MSHAIQPGASMHGIALNHDFQHSPTGTLGGRSVQQGAAQAPRSLGRVLSDVGRSIQNLGSRLLNAVTPHGVRADSKFRAGMQDTSAQLGRLLGALSQSNQQAPDPAAAQRLLQALPSTATPVTSRGLSYDHLIAQRAAVHLDNMTAAQRQALHSGLAQAESGPPLQGDATLALVRGLMEQRAIDAGVPALQGGLDLAIASVAKEAQDKGITGRAFDELYNTARNVLTEQGFGQLPPAALKDMSRALILQALEDRLGGMDDEAAFVPIATMINALPSKQLHALMHQAVQIGSRPAEDISIIVLGAIGRRADQLEQTLNAGFAALLGHRQPAEGDPDGVLHNPHGFAREAATTGQALTELRQHCELHGMHFPAHLETAHARTQDHLEGYLSADNLIQLPELNSRQLHALGQGLRQLGVESGQAAITADAARRRTESLDAYARVLQPGLQALARGDMAATLSTLASAQPHGDEALEIHMRLGMKVEGADEIMNFRAQLTEHALRGLNAPVLTALSQRLNSPAVSEGLINALADAAMPLVSGSSGMQAYDQGLGRTMFNRTTDLSILRTIVDERLGQLGVQVPDPLWAGPLDPAQLIRSEYGVSLTSDGNVAVRAGRAGPAVQQAVQANLDVLLNTQQDLQPHATHALVSDAFIKDLPRARYQMIGNDGAIQVLYQGQPADPDAQMQVVVGQLRTLAGNDDQLLMLASRLAHQGVQAGLQRVMLSQQSPVRLPDGTAGRLMGDEQSTYSFSSDGEGGLNLRVEYAISNPTAFLPAPRHADDGIGRPIMLVPDQSSASFGFSLHIAADRSVRFDDPMQYVYDAVRAD